MGKLKIQYWVFYMEVKLLPLFTFYVQIDFDRAHEQIISILILVPENKEVHKIFMPPLLRGWGGIRFALSVCPTICDT